MVMGKQYLNENSILDKIRNWIAFFKKSFMRTRYRFSDIKLIDITSHFSLNHNVIKDLSIYLEEIDYELNDFGGWASEIEAERSQTQNRNSVQIIDDLIGIRGMSRPATDEINKYLSFFLNDRRFKFDLKDVIKSIDGPAFKLADLHSVFDVIVINDLLKAVDKPTVLEIGGGYGRLVEAYSLNGVGEFAWNLIDVVPSSLQLSYDYLKKSGLDVSFVRDESEFSKINIFQLPYLERIPDKSIDLVINIESFQEMTQKWVDYWITIINKKTNKGSYFYHCNSFTYKNNFILNLGSNWICIESINSPRHWTDSHKTEIWLRVE
jgi:putative sugar O-methyltransferase